MAIVDDSWKNYRIGWRDPKDADKKKKVFVLARPDVKQLVINRNPHVYFLQYHQRGFEFATTTPVLQATFSDYLVGEPVLGSMSYSLHPSADAQKKKSWH